MTEVEAEEGHEKKKTKKLKYAELAMTANPRVPCEVRDAKHSTEEIAAKRSPVTIHMCKSLKQGLAGRSSRIPIIY